jgi:thermitase
MFVGALAMVAVLASGSGWASEKRAAFIPGEIIVKINRNDLSPTKAKALIHSALAKSVHVRSISSLFADDSLQKVVLSKGESVYRAIERLKKTSGIRHAEPNHIYSLAGFERALPDDERVAELWGLNNTGQRDREGQAGIAGADIHVLPLWDQGIRGDRKWIVAVVDTGIEWSHPDLVDNLYTNRGEVPGNKIDDDQNGLVDDIHGWNFIHKNAFSQDDHGHGTHCAGTIGATGNNGKGVTGVNWQVSLMPLKILDRDGNGSLDAAVDAIYYAARMGVHVMNNSWGGGAQSEILREAIEHARDAGILFVAAAGNTRTSCNNDVTPSYPANYDVENIISVAASDNRDQLASFSCVGKRTVHVAAPGAWILSTYKDQRYELMRGTSMAAPHVAGVAALLLSARPDWTFAEIKDRLVRSTDKVGNMKRRIKGSGRINATQAWMGVYPPSFEPDESAWKDISVNIESPHPYADKSDLTFPIEVPGAQFVRLIFEQVELEWGYDRLWLEDRTTGQKIMEVEGRAQNLVSDYVEGSKARLRFTSDASVNNWGFKVTRIQAIY